MKTDAEVRRMVKERATGKTQEQAAAHTGMSVRTLRTYERAGTLPSQRKQPRTYQTRPNPFADDWSWVQAELERDPALQATTLFALLCERHPGRFQQVQLRTLQRHIATWRAQHGPAQEVMFPQVHQPGEAAQSDFTHMGDLGVTLGGLAFPHLLFHLVSALRRASRRWPKGWRRVCGSSAACRGSIAPIISARRSARSMLMAGCRRRRATPR
jgi:transcriptional regulator with XRE-family HTH domain